MMKITREEAIAIRKNLRGVQVVVTNRGAKSKARTYYVEQTGYTMNFLEKYHHKDKLEHYE